MDQNRKMIRTANKSTKTESLFRTQRACDSCRSRKIRCDRSTPCSNCQASKLKCTTTLQFPKPSQPSRLHVSEEYERKIDRIEDRLDGIDRILGQLNAQLDTQLNTHDLPVRARYGGSSRDIPRRNVDWREKSDGGTNTPFEGEPAMNSQFNAAQNLLERAVGDNLSFGQNAELQASLKTLQDLVARQGQVSSKAQYGSKISSDQSLEGKEMPQYMRPSWPMVEELLHYVTAYPTMWYPMVGPLIKPDTLRDVFKEIVESPEQSTPSQRVLAYGLWYNIFVELAHHPHLKHKKEEYIQWALSTQPHVENAMQQLDLCLSPSYENAVTLLIAAWYSIELSKPSLCWTMTSAAAGMCQTLGYHRYSTMQADTDDLRTAKLYIYWSIYILDKSLSLRLGRASAMPDWDTSLPYPCVDITPASHTPGGQWQAPKAMQYWIEVARIQGQTYELLYSPGAFMKSAEERAKAVSDLIQALEQAWLRRGEAPVIGLLPACPSFDPKIGQSAARPDEFGPFPSTIKQPEDREEPDFCTTAIILFHYADIATHYSTAALIHRAASRDSHTLTPACLSAARSALVTHQATSEKFNMEGNELLWSGYVHWSVLQAPFTPFIVLFTSLIQHPTTSDSSLAILSSFVQSLKSLRDLSEGVGRLYKMCSLFLSIAGIYVEAKKNSEITTSEALGTGRSNDSNESNDIAQFDPYLSALGLIPNEHDNENNNIWPLSTRQNAGADITFPDAGIHPSFPSDTESDPSTMNQYQSSNSVQDWFSGSRYLISLMEDDIQMPDFAF